MGLNLFVFSFACVYVCVCIYAMSVCVNDTFVHSFSFLFCSPSFLPIRSISCLFLSLQVFCSKQNDGDALSS